MNKKILNLIEMVKSKHDLMELIENSLNELSVEELKILTESNAHKRILKGIGLFGAGSIYGGTVGHTVGHQTGIEQGHREGIAGTLKAKELVDRVVKSRDAEYNKTSNKIKRTLKGLIKTRPDELETVSTYIDLPTKTRFAHKIGTDTYHAGQKSIADKIREKLKK